MSTVLTSYPPKVKRDPLSIRDFNPQSSGNPPSTLIDAPRMPQRSESAASAAAPAPNPVDPAAAPMAPAAPAGGDQYGRFANRGSAGGTRPTVTQRTLGGEPLAIRNPDGNTINVQQQRGGPGSTGGRPFTEGGLAPNKGRSIGDAMDARRGPDAPAWASLTPVQRGEELRKMKPSGPVGTVLSKYNPATGQTSDGSGRRIMTAADRRAAEESNRGRIAYYREASDRTDAEGMRMRTAFNSQRDGADPNMTGAEMRDGNLVARDGTVIGGAGTQFAQNTAFDIDGRAQAPAAAVAQTQTPDQPRDGEQGGTISMRDDSADGSGSEIAQDRELQISGQETRTGEGPQAQQPNESQATPQDRLAQIQPKPNAFGRDSLLQSTQALAARIERDKQSGWVDSALIQRNEDLLEQRLRELEGREPIERKPPRRRRFIRSEA
jgi:hypothetical protein